MEGNTLQPYSKFNMVTTAYPVTFTFTVKSIFTNDLFTLSPIAKMTIVCATTYTITNTTAYDNPQYISHLGTDTQGFKLPGY